MQGSNRRTDPGARARVGSWAAIHTASPYPAANVLVMDTDRGMTQEEAVSGVLNGMGYAHHIVEGLPNAETMKAYDAIIWVTATPSGGEGVLPKEGIEFVGEYLEAGGNVWLQGPRAAAYLPGQGAAAWGAGYFGVVADNNLLNSWGTVTGQGGPVWGERSFELSYLDRRAYIDQVFLAAEADVFGTASGILIHEDRPERFAATAVEGNAEHGGFRAIWSGATTASTVSAAEQTATMREVLDFFEVAPLTGAPTPGPGVQGYRIEHLMPGRDYTINVGATGNVGSVTLNYRTFGDEVAYTALPMTAAGAGLYSATIPGADVFNNGIQYYVEAVMADGTVVRTAEPTLPNAASAGYGDAAQVTYGDCADGAPTGGAAAPAPAPLPTTGGGLALIGLALLGLGVATKRRIG